MKPLDPNLLEAFSQYFDVTTFQRGVAYAQEGRVRLQNIHADDREIEIHATCRGSGASEYDTSVFLDYTEHGFFDFAGSACTCPVGEDCKHTVAVLLSYFQHLHQSLGLDDEADHDETGAASTAQAHTVRATTQAWLDDLVGQPAAGNEASDKSDPTPFIVYLLHLDTTPIALSLGKSKPLKRGGVSKPSSFTPQPEDLHPRLRRNFVTQEDALPLQLIMGFQDPYGYYSRSNAPIPVAMDSGGVLLEHALQTGRLYIKGDMSRALTPTSRPLELEWITDKKGQQYISIHLSTDLALLPTWPLLYVDRESYTLGKLESPYPKEFVQKLLTAPPLTEHEAAVVRAKLADVAKRHAIEIPLPNAVEPETPAAPPVATLKLTTGRFMHEAASSLYDEYPIGVLRFDYAEGVTAEGCEEPEPLISFKKDGQAHVLRRDLDTERAIWAKLQSIGLESHYQRLPRYNWLNGTGTCLLSSPLDSRGWLAILDGGLEQLESEGIRIEYEDEFPLELAQADDWFVALEEEAQSDWFDLDLGVLIDGERVSLVSPLLNLLRTQPNILQRLDALTDAHRIPLTLDEKRFLPIPVPRLKAWLKPLLEFLDDDRPRLSRYHAAALADLGDQDVQWLSGDALRALGGKLRDFSGIAETPPAPQFQATLRPYQQAGLSWLQFLREYGFAGILADDMGLGKTVQTLAHIQLEKQAGRADRPSLVIAPTSLLPNWAAEARQFAPDLKLVTLHGPDRAQHFDTLPEADLILTTYPLLVRDRDVLTHCEYHLLVLDEAQFIKNPKAQSHAAARQIKARHRLSLTGTPLENHLGELWAQFDFLMPGMLGNVKRFNETFRNPIEKQADSDARQRLSRRVAPFVLRRTKEQVLAELPPCTEIVRWVEFSDAQRDLYESLRIAFDKKLRTALQAQGVGRSQIMILDALLKLRQVCCDPRLVKLDSAQKIGAQGSQHSAKLTELLELVTELLDEGRRILLFSQFTSMLGLIEAEFRKRGWGYSKLTGQTRDRAQPVRDFQDGKVPIMMISLKAGGTGLNLTAADTVIHYDPWWNPAVEAQATARAHRMGQDKPVFVYKLLGRGTVEEKILALQSRKKGLSDQMLSGQKDDSGGHLITAEDLDVLFEPLSAG